VVGFAGVTGQKHMNGTHARGNVQDEANERQVDTGTGMSHGTTLPSWRFTADAWRWARRLNVGYVDAAFRARSARVIPASARARFIRMGIPADVVDDTLGRIRRANDWSSKWVETAQRFLGDFRRQTSAANIREAAQARQLAALCYHAAQIFEPFDPMTVRKCRSAAASLFTQALPQLHPNVRHLWIPWRSKSLPAYFELPELVSEPVGLVVVLNGASMSKEETFTWCGPLIDHGYDVIAMDSPGTGEATGVGSVGPDQDDILDGIIEMFRNEPMIDLSRVVAVGASLGGNQAVRAAAHDRRIMAAVAVTPPYDPARWIHRASPLLHGELGLLVDGKLVPGARDMIAGFSLEDVSLASRQPMLIFGGGRDVIVPPTEAQLLAKRVGGRATLVWYPTGGHCLYELVDQWMFEAAVWIDAVADARGSGGPQDSPARVAAMAARALELTEYVPQFGPGGLEAEDESDEYARLLTTDAGNRQD
jgi:pimeloyl-ACP methyl ester carboxylesterase